MNLQHIINIAPLVVAVFYFVVGGCYIAKKDYPWAIVWISYALANLGLIMVGMKK